MSAEHVDLVRRLQPPPEMDIAAVLREGESAGQVFARMAPFFHDELVTVVHAGSDQIEYEGADALRTAWLEWVAPWASYRTEINELIDAGDRVVVLASDFARLREDGPEVELRATAIWTVADGKVRRAEFFSDREAGLRAAGLGG